MASPTLLSRGIVNKALNDPKFFEAVPEYRTLQPKMKTMQLDDKRSCGGCKGRRVEQNMFGDFMLVLRSLDAAALTRFKRYLGIEAMMYSFQNPQTGAFETKLI